MILKNRYLFNNTGNYVFYAHHSLNERATELDGCFATTTFGEHNYHQNILILGHSVQLNIYILSFRINSLSSKHNYNNVILKQLNCMYFCTQ